MIGVGKYGTIRMVCFAYSLYLASVYQSVFVYNYLDLTIMMVVAVLVALLLTYWAVMVMRQEIRITKNGQLSRNHGIKSLGLLERLINKVLSIFNLKLNSTHSVLHFVAMSNMLVVCALLFPPSMFVILLVVSGLGLILFYEWLLRVGETKLVIKH